MSLQINVIKTLFVLSLYAVLKMTAHIIVFLSGTHFQLEQVAPFWPVKLTLSSIWSSGAGFRIARVWKALIRFERRCFSVCAQAGVSLHRAESDNRLPFSLRNLSESLLSCFGAGTEVPVYLERGRRRGLAGRRVAKATGNSAGMVVKEEGGLGW